MDITNISASGLRKAAAIKDKIEELQSDLEKLLGSGGDGVGNGRVVDGRKKKRTMSAAARAKIAAAQRARWAKQKAGK
jgi:hypothetical protein